MWGDAPQATEAGWLLINRENVANTCVVSLCTMLRSRSDESCRCTFVDLLKVAWGAPEPVQDPRQDNRR